MMDLLVLKERIKNIYQKSELYLEPLVKFIMAFIVFMIININIGYNPELKSMWVVILLSILSAFTPSSILVLLAAIVMVGHVYAVAKVLSVIVILILFILYFLFAKFTPKLGLVILMLPILFVLKIPYVIPILLGMIAGPAAIIPAACGVVIYYLLEVIKGAAEMAANLSVEDTLELYQYVIDGLVRNKDMMLTMVIFSVVIIITFSVRKMSFDHAFDIAIGTGVVTNILGFLIGGLNYVEADHIGIMMLGSIVSGIIVYVIQFFRLTLDYTGVERVQFEDDDYYYYVKAIPKINVTAPKKNIKRFGGQVLSEKDTDDFDYDFLDDVEVEDFGDKE